jgi:hypothetical protein
MGLYFAAIGQCEPRAVVIQLIIEPRIFRQPLCPDLIAVTNDSENVPFRVTLS